MNKNNSALITLSVLTAALVSGPVAGAANANRLALVIGNDVYLHVSPLKNAGNDARLIGATLTDAGFEVLGGVRTNLNRDTMWNAIDQLQRRIQKGDEVVFYFAGHGVQIGSDAMLLPVDISAESDQQLLRNGVNLAEVQDQLKDARFALLVVDACRDNPFPVKPGHTRGIGATRGLVPILAAEGNLILMAAGPRQRALDMVPGVTTNDGLFTYTLVQAIRTPGLDVRTAMYRVRDEVEDRAKRANYDQRPSLTDEMRGTFAFFPTVRTAADARMSTPSVTAAQGPKQEQPEGQKQGQPKGTLRPPVSQSAEESADEGKADLSYARALIDSSECQARTSGCTNHDSEQIQDECISAKSGWRGALNEETSPEARKRMLAKLEPRARMTCRRDGQEPICVASGRSDNAKNGFSGVFIRGTVDCRESDEKLL